MGVRSGRQPLAQRDHAVHPPPWRIFVRDHLVHPRAPLHQRHKPPAGQQRDPGVGVTFADVAQGAIGEHDVAQCAELGYQYVVAVFHEVGLAGQA